jgi:hypothetical protein
MFDLTVNLGHILNVIAILIGGGIIAGTIRSRIDALEKEIEKLSEILVTTARQDVRLDFLDQRIEELRNCIKSR